MTDPLRADLVEHILACAPSLSIAVLGDLFLDRYLDIDAALTEPSLETGLGAYQVVRVRPSPGAAGTVINNLLALGVGLVSPVAVLGDDGEGHELRHALLREGLGRVGLDGVLSWAGRRTPTYTKPILHVAGAPPRELNRLDIKNRAPLPASAEEGVLAKLDEVWEWGPNALLVLDQVSEADCGVVTARVRARLASLAASRPERFVLADSRERIGLFRNVAVKPNERECRGAVPAPDVSSAAAALARQVGGAVFCTRGELGILLAEEGGARTEVPAYPVVGPIDPVGAGDSTSAGIACAVAAGASMVEAAAFGNLIASITVQQIGTTGTASPAQVRARWKELRKA